MCVKVRQSTKITQAKNTCENTTKQPWTKVNFPLAYKTAHFIFANIWPHFCSRVRDFLVLFKMMSKCLVLTLMVSLSVCAPRPKADPDHLHYAYGRNYHYDPYAVHHAGYEHKRGYHHDIPGHHAYGTKKKLIYKRKLRGLLLWFSEDLSFIWKWPKITDRYIFNARVLISISLTFRATVFSFKYSL